MKLHVTCASICLLVLGLSVTNGQDNWPQWGGPNRDHKSPAKGLMQEWPEGGPKLVWKVDTAGMGYSSLSVVDGRIYSLGSNEGKNFAFCIESATGKPVWKTETGAAVDSKAYNAGWGTGPRSTPTVTADKVFVLDDAGNLCCLKRTDGKLVWKVNLISDLGGSMPKWGFSESPLVDGNRVIICPGGPKFLQALNIETGKVELTSSDYSADPHYVSVLKHQVGGVACYTTACGQGLVSFAADDGRKLWTNSYTGAAVATIPTPVIVDNMVYHTADYGSGCVLVKLTASGNTVTAEEVYANKNQQNHHGGVVLVDKTVYGYKKGGGWVAQDFASGEVTFQSRQPEEGGASVAFADGRLYVYGERTGTCYLVEPNPKDFVVKGKLPLPAKSGLDRGKGAVWNHPVIAEGKLFLRDLDMIYAFDIKK